MKYIVKDKNGKESVQDLTRRKAITWFCWQCPHYGGYDAITAIHKKCQQTSCKLFDFQISGVLRPGQTAESRAKAIRWFCDICKRTDPDRMANYEDIVNCPKRTCALFPFRLQNTVDMSVKIYDSGPAEPAATPEETIIEAPFEEIAPVFEPKEPAPELFLDDILATFAPVAPDIEVSVHEKYITR
jgi:hypothetical protein